MREGMSDVQILKRLLYQLKNQTNWDGRESVLEMKEAEGQWRQMEWWAFYFEFLCKKLLSKDFQIPGDQYGNTTFDIKRKINWDLKAHAIKSNRHETILNDVKAMRHSVREHGKHGEIIALCDVEYNDDDRTFQKWHTELKGGLSVYEKQRVKRTNVSRYRKTSAVLTEILLIELTADDLDKLAEMKQGRNSNGKPRPTKYVLDLEDIDSLKVKRITF